MKIYTLDACEKLIDRYINQEGGNMLTITKGTLGLGMVLLHGAIGKCNIVIQEVFLNEWASAHTVRQYKKIPKKYEKFLL